MPAKRRWKPIATLHRPTRPVPGVEQGAGDDPDRVGEVDDPGARRRPAGGALRDVQHHRHRAQRLGEAAGAGGLLADAAALQRKRLVADPGRLAADAQLDQHDVGTVEAIVHIGRPAHPARMAVMREQSGAEPTDRLQPLGGGVDEHQLVDGEQAAQPGEAVRELRRVRRPAADHCDLETHPLTPVSVTPWTNAFCAKKKTITMGTMVSNVAAEIRCHSTWCSDLNDARPSESVHASSFSLV